MNNTNNRLNQLDNQFGHPIYDFFSRYLFIIVIIMIIITVILIVYSYLNYRKRNKIKS